MSRYTIHLEDNKTFNFGFDHALGFFYDIFDETEEEILEEKSSLFGRLTGFQLSEKIEKTVPANKLIRFADHLERMKLDFDF